VGNWHATASNIERKALCSFLLHCADLSNQVSGSTPSLRSFPPSLLHSFTPSLLHSFAPSLLHSFAPSLLHSFPSLLHSFTPS
jgi:hypothetical protein